MTDVNWPVVLQASSFSQPYQVNGQVKEVEREVFTDNIIICQNCNATVLHIPSPKEINDFKK